MICHNNKDDIENYEKNKIILNNNEPIIVAFWGMIRQEKYFEKVIKFFCNDKMFKVCIYGEGKSENLKYFCKIT